MESMEPKDRTIPDLLYRVAIGALIFFVALLVGISAAHAMELVPQVGPPRWRVFEIAVRVTWDERRQVELATLRTVPAVTMPGTLGAQAAPGQSSTPGTGGRQ